MKKLSFLAKALRMAGGAQLLNLYWGQDRLTVLAYHRILDWQQPGFDYYAPNVSTTPQMFARQMDYAARHFNVISLQNLLAFIQHNEPLPPRPCLITFDDGYLDNYENAYPVLKQHGFPAIIFLMTSGMTNPARPWWDQCAYYFFHTQKRSVDLPIIGTHSLDEKTTRIAARESLIRKMKTLPNAEKQAVVDQLPELLEVSPPRDNDARLFLTWDHVRELIANGVACQPHTVTHPILSRIPLEEQQRELTESKAAIEAETQQAAIAFAYPNGTLVDYDQNTVALLRKLDYQLAFTLEDGPMPNQEVRENPLEIKRIFLSHRDTFDVFVFKLMGLPTFVPGY